jgi:hypothetical protein
MHVLTLSTAMLQIIDQALQQAPYRLSAPVINEINRQLAAKRAAATTETHGDLEQTHNLPIPVAAMKAMQ